MHHSFPSSQSLDLKLGTVALFCKAAELGGFTAAAQALGLTPAAVSRGVGRLEERLGVKLFRRTTRRVQLTDDGRVYYEQCKAALTQIDDAEKTITGQHGQPRGLLRISAPSTYAHYRLLPRLPAFRALYPEIELEINVANRNIDFIDDGYDIAIRLGEPRDSRLVARKLEDAPLGVYASPAYLRAQDAPRSVQDLASGTHTLLPFVRPSTGRVMPWLLNIGGKATEWLPQSRVCISEGPLGCVVLARHGMGLVQTFDWIAASYSGELQPVVPELNGCTRPFYLLYPHNRHLSARVRVLVDYLEPTQ